MNEQRPISGNEDQEEISRVLELQESGHSPGAWVVRLAVVFVVLAAIGFFTYSWLVPPPTAYKTEPVTQTDIAITVNATGTLQPLNQVEVGVEISGTLAEVLVDFNDEVRAGDVLARIDTEQLEAARKQAAASLNQSRARLSEARASAREAKSRLERSQQLAARGFLSDQGLETAQANLDRANASVQSAAAQVELARAALEANDTNLSKAIIRAPIDGILLSRKVEPGQTVAASFQTPTLFVIAEDLSRMELHVDIDEADIGIVKDGQTAKFNVDAYPGRQFQAQIESVRNAPQTVQGVVTYEAVLTLDNADLSLKPGMTATAEILIKNIENALALPNASLRFTPEGEEAALPSRLEDGSGNSAGQVYILDTDQIPKAVSVTIGDSDGVLSVLLDGDLAAGDEVIVDIDQSTD